MRTSTIHRRTYHTLRLLEDKRGFGLIEVIIAGALIAIISVGTSAIISYMYKAQRNITQKNEFEAFVIRIRQLLTNPDICVSVLPVATEVFPMNPADTDKAPIFAAPRSLRLLDGEVIAKEHDIDSLTGPERKRALKDTFVITQFRYTALRTLDAVAGTFEGQLSLRAAKYPKSNRPEVAGGEFRPRDISLSFSTIPDPADPTKRQASTCVASAGTALDGNCLPGQVMVGVEQASNTILCEPQVPCREGQHPIRGFRRDAFGNMLAQDGTIVTALNGLAAAPGWECTGALYRFCNGACP